MIRRTTSIPISTLIEFIGGVMAVMLFLLMLFNGEHCLQSILNPEGGLGNCYYAKRRYLSVAARIDRAILGNTFWL